LAHGCPYLEGFRNEVLALFPKRAAVLAADGFQACGVPRIRKPALTCLKAAWTSTTGANLTDPVRPRHPWNTRIRTENERNRIRRHYY